MEGKVHPTAYEVVLDFTDAPVLMEKYGYAAGTSNKVVLPEETDDIQIEHGKNYVTLLTCTPYGVNSHRLLV